MSAARKRGAAKRSTAQRRATTRDAAKGRATKRDAIERGAAKRGTTKRGTAKRGTTNRSTTKRGTAKRSTVKRSSAKRGTPKGLTTTRGTTQRDAARDDATTRERTTRRPAAERVEPARARVPDAPPTGAQVPHVAGAPPDGAAARRARKLEKQGRAAARAAHMAARRGHVDEGALAAAMAARLLRDDAAAAAASARPTRRGTPRAKTRASGDAARWVPIGPSVVRRGQAEGLPHVAGRIRDLAVASDGRRAYAASGFGGVWYTDDGAATWRAVGAWTDRRAAVGGQRNAHVCGALLVHFGATAAADYVMVGTGEHRPYGPLDSPASPGVGAFGGIGVLAGRGAAVRRDDEPAWEPGAPRAFGAPHVADPLEGRGIFRLVRDPASTPGADRTTGGDVRDRVVAATSDGLFVGTRALVGGTPRWTWSRCTSVDTRFGARPIISDAVWIARPGEGGAAEARTGRLYIAVWGQGVAWTDDLGATVAGWRWVRHLNRATDGVPVGRMSFARVADRLYVLGEQDAPGVPNSAFPSVWRIDGIGGAPVVVGTTGVNGLVRPLPAGGGTYALWTTQGWYDQAIAVESITPASDRLWLGGQGISFPASGQFGASLFCVDAALGAPAPVLPAPPVPLVLTAAAGISRIGGPAAGGDGAELDWVIGANVHADVHVIRRVNPAGAAGQVWVGCDGGCYVSAGGGAVNTFQPRNIGLGILEAGYVALHPRSSQFVAAGAQDNGCNVRSGDMVWEQIAQGDGGGTLIDPARPHVIVSQFMSGRWRAVPGTAYVDPLARTATAAVPNGDREDGAAQFYSGASATERPGGSRVAIGTDRVWITDTLGAPGGTQWLALPLAPGVPGTAGAVTAATDARPGGADASPTFGVVPAVGSPALPLIPGAGLGPVMQLRWDGASVLFALHTNALVRHDNVAGTNWRSTLLLPHAAAGAPNPAVTRLQDVQPVADSGGDLYLVGVGEDSTTLAPPVETCWFYAAATDRWIPTRLRQQLNESLPSAPPGTPPVLGPLDPAYAVAVDPVAPHDVFVGTVTGVWHGRVAGGGGWDWWPFVNGLPQLAVQDLAIWRPAGAAAGAPRLLRAALQSRGVWEVNLAADEPPRTWLRVHARDDRRTLPVPLDDPRRPLGSDDFVSYASPDIVVRPESPRPTDPALRWPRAAAARLDAGDSGSFDLWTFQTAFRWHFPSIRADGLWRDELADLVERHRATLGLVAGRHVDRALWDAVVGGTRLTAAGLLGGGAGDPYAVWRAPWTSALAMDTIATEVDLLECVQPLRARGAVWHVRRGRSVVEVLLHHRDTRALAPGHAYAALWWRAAPRLDTLMALPAAPFAALHAWRPATVVPAGSFTDPAAPPAMPAIPALPAVAGWTPANPTARTLPVALDALLPRAIPFPLELTAPDGHFVALVAVAGGSAEHPPPPTGLGASATVRDLVRRWPRAALRIVRVRAPASP